VSIRTRLTLLFFAVTVAAVAAIYLYVMPQLESTLREQRLRSLESAASGYSDDIRDALLGEDREATQRTLRMAADQTPARVTLMRVGERGIGPYIEEDSAELGNLGEASLAVADRAAATKRTETDWGSGLAQVARPLFQGDRLVGVAVFSAPLGEVEQNVAVIRRQILIAGGIGLLLALAAATLASRSMSGRVKALEQGAERVAAGDFSAEFPIAHDDELGQLARALDDMQRQLAQLDSARKRFVATASHELRTPIFSLGGFLELLEDEDLDEETRAQFLRHVREQVVRLQKLATDLLDLSKLDSGSLDLRPEPTDVGVLARTVAGEFAPALAEHGTRLLLRLDGEDIHADCDPERLAQILRILIDNALTHTPSGTEIAVSAVRENGRVRVAIRDRGPGIARDAVDRVFEPFYTSDDAQGSGLGLAIARELAERMGGRLGVDSRPGRTTFAVELPAS
jgi:two-component system OmpR family sensor kinase